MKLSELPINPADVIKDGRAYKEERDREIRATLLIDPAAGDDLITDVRLLLVPQTARAELKTVVIDGEPTKRALLRQPDFVVLILGDEKERAAHQSDEMLRLHLHREGAHHPCAILARSGKPAAIARRLGVSLTDVVIGADAGALAAGLAAWCAAELPDHRLALAANFAFMRDAIAAEYIKATSLQNGIIGGVLFIPGADLPLMTVNQIKMVLQIAAAFGEPLNAERAKELAVVIGSAFGFRALARELVGAVPGIGWVVKAGIGYAATYAMGKTTVAYFAQGGSIANVGKHLVTHRGEILADARRKAAQGPSVLLPDPQHLARTAETIYHEARNLYRENAGHDHLPEARG